jgi:DNA-binding transcriptional regulator YhcF (GntR family)
MRPAAARIAACPPSCPASAHARKPRSLDRKRQAAPQVFDRLRESILALELVPGAVLARNEMAAMFGVSQTPVRDALIKLSEEGPGRHLPQHATVVSRIDVAQALQAHFLRRAIELEVAARWRSPPSCWWRSCAPRSRCRRRRRQYDYASSSPPTASSTG